MSVVEKEVLLKAIYDPTFAKGSFADLGASVFSEKKEYKEIYHAIREHYRYHGTPLTERTLSNQLEERMLRRKTDEEVVDEHLERVHELYTIERSDSDEEVVNRRINTFVRSKLVYGALTEFITSGSDFGDEEELEKLVPELQRISTMNVSGDDGILVDFFEDVEQKKELYKQVEEVRFRTGFSAIDRISGGGIGRGEVGMLLGATGSGKTTWAVQQLNNYTKAGLNTLYIALEENLGRMLLKIEQNMLGVNKKALFTDDGDLREDVFDGAQEIYKDQINLGKLFVSKHLPQEVTVSDIEQIILDVKYRKGVELDVVIIDYPDLMKNTYAQAGASESDAGGKLMEDIRALAGKHKYVCWVLGQLNRSGWGQDIRTAESIEGSKRKLNAVEMAFTLNQTNEEFERGLLRIHIDKMRYSNDEPYNRIQYFKMERDGLRIRDESPEEIEDHKALLGEPSGYGDNKQNNNNQQALDRVNAINQQVGGGK